MKNEYKLKIRNNCASRSGNILLAHLQPMPFMRRGLYEILNINKINKITKVNVCLRKNR